MSRTTITSNIQTSKLWCDIVLYHNEENTNDVAYHPKLYWSKGTSDITLCDLCSIKEHCTMPQEIVPECYTIPQYILLEY